MGISTNTKQIKTVLSRALSTQPWKYKQKLSRLFLKHFQGIKWKSSTPDKGICGPSPASLVGSCLRHRVSEARAVKIKFHNSRAPTPPASASPTNPPNKRKRLANLRCLPDILCGMTAATRKTTTTATATTRATTAATTQPQHEILNETHAPPLSASARTAAAQHTAVRGQKRCTEGK